MRLRFQTNANGMDFMDGANVGEDENEVEVSNKCTWDEFLWMVLMFERMKLMLKDGLTSHSTVFALSWMWQGLVTMLLYL